MRIELLTPARRPPDQRGLQPRLHAARRDHGVVLPDPVDPQHLRQFPHPADDRRARPRLPAAQPARAGTSTSSAGCSRSACWSRGGVDTGWTFYTPLSSMFANGQRGAGGDGDLHRRLLVDPHRPELHRHHPQAARAGHDLGPAAAVRVVALRDLADPGAGDAGAGDHAGADRGRAAVRPRHLRSRARRRSAALPAPVLVLQPPGRLHHGAAGASAWSASWSRRRRASRSSATGSWRAPPSPSR